MGGASELPDDEVVGTRRTPEAAEVLGSEAARDIELEDHAALEQAAREGVAAHLGAVVRAQVASEGLARASRLADDRLAEGGVPAHVRRPPPRLRYPRWGWRRAIRTAVERRMLTGQYLTLYRRALTHRARAAATGAPIVFHGMLFSGKRVELTARRGHGRLVIGPWCWIGNDNKLRAHEGQLTLGAKVVMGRDNVFNTYFDIEVGDATILADWIYVCDFDHRYDRLDVPIKDQGIVTSPVRIGGDVWIGEKATVLRGVDIGHGAVIASHGMVRSDLPPFAIAGGVPARVLKSRLPAGIDPEEALAHLRRGEPIPGDPLER